MRLPGPRLLRRWLARVPPRRAQARAAALVAALVLLGGTARGPGAIAPPLLAAQPEGTGCRHWAVLLPEDGSQHRVYDGIRKGLELAQLQRVCLKDLPAGAADVPAFVAGLAAVEPHPLVFAVGERAAAALVDAGLAGPGVVVSSGTTRGGAPLVGLRTLPPGLWRIRGEIAAEAVGSTLREALGVARPRVAFAWDGAPGPLPAGLLAVAERFAEGAGLERVALEATGARAPQALLHLRLGLDEALLPFAAAREQALRLRVPLVGDDLARFGAGAALVLAPDPERLGRQAAEAGRRLWVGEAPPAESLGVRDLRVAVDVDAAEAQGWSPPLSFLAKAHDLRMRAPPAPAAPAGAR